MLSTGALRAHLLAARLAGPVATSREESLRSYRLFAARDPRLMLGLDPEWTWCQRDLIELMADKCGVSADPLHTSGHDVIDPERTLAALDAFAERLGEAARHRHPVLLGTGHPHRLIDFYAALADALSAAGCAVLTPAQGSSIDITTRFGLRTYSLDYVQGVALVREPEGEPPVVRPAHTPIHPSRSGPFWRPPPRAEGPSRSWSSGTTDGSAEQVSWGSRPSVSPIRTIPRCSSERQRGGCPSPFP